MVDHEGIQRAVEFDHHVLVAVSLEDVLDFRFADVLGKVTRHSLALHDRPLAAGDDLHDHRIRAVVAAEHPAHLVELLRLQQLPERAHQKGVVVPRLLRDLLKVGFLEIRKLDIQQENRKNDDHPDDGGNEQQHRILARHQLHSPAAR